MRLSFLVYGVLYVVIEIVGQQLESIGWPQLTALDVATAVVNALLVVAVGVAALVGLDVLGHWWRRRQLARAIERAQLAEEEAREPIVVRAWRPRLALPGRANAYSGIAQDVDDPYLAPDFLEDHGRLL